MRVILVLHSKKLTKLQLIARFVNAIVKILSRWNIYIFYCTNWIFFINLKKQGPKVNKMVVQTVNFDPTKSSAASVKVNNKIKTVKLGQFSW